MSSKPRNPLRSGGDSLSTTPNYTPPEVKPHYRSGSDDLRRDFFWPCFARCTKYRRSVGYFSSEALVSWFTGLVRIFRQQRGPTLLILASYNLSSGDTEALSTATNEEGAEALAETPAHALLNTLMRWWRGAADESERAQLLSWLIVNGYLEIRFGTPSSKSDPGLFHEKIGLFDFSEGYQIAFTGSANETEAGHTRNYESIDVYRNWLDNDAERVTIKEQQFEEAWRGEAPGLRVDPLSDDVIEKLRTIATTDTNTQPYGGGQARQSVQKLWAHQQEAIAAALKHEKGILEMATGTGKTLTALKLLEVLYEERKIRGAVITTDGNDLLTQWVKDIDRQETSTGARWAIYRHYECFAELGRFVIGEPSGRILVIGRRYLPELVQRLSDDKKRQLAVIHDEVHGLGQPQLVTALPGTHQAFPYVYGLSATPERAYDEAGNELIRNEVGDTLYTFGIDDAIRSGILCEFDYVALPYELTENDRERINNVFKRKAAADKQGTPLSDETLWIALSRVYKTAEQKVEVFDDYIGRHPETLKSTIIFVEEVEYGERLLPLVHRHTSRYRTYFGEDDKEHLRDFAKGNIDCLITCHKLSQGIDIKRLRHVFLFASARARLETIQRIGRCLRIDPWDLEKRARVIDFVRHAPEGEDIPDADYERSTWLSELADTRRAV